MFILCYHRRSHVLHIKAFYCRNMQPHCCVFILEIPSTKGSEEEEDCEVWDGGTHHRLPHLHHLVSTAFHLIGQICCGCGQSSSGRYSYCQAWRLWSKLWGEHLVQHAWLQCLINLLTQCFSRWTSQSWHPLISISNCFPPEVVMWHMLFSTAPVYHECTAAVYPALHRGRLQQAFRQVQQKCCECGLLLLILPPSFPFSVDRFIQSNCCNDYKFLFLHLAAEVWQQIHFQIPCTSCCPLFDAFLHSINSCPLRMRHVDDGGFCMSIQVAMQFISLYSYEDIVTANIEGSSGSVWRISPPSRQEVIRELLRSPMDMTLRLTWDFQRLVYFVHLGDWGRMSVRKGAGYRTPDASQAPNDSKRAWNYLFSANVLTTMLCDESHRQQQSWSSATADDPLHRFGLWPKPLACLRSYQCPCWKSGQVYFFFFSPETEHWSYLWTRRWPISQGLGKGWHSGAHVRHALHRSGAPWSRPSRAGFTAGGKSVGSSVSTPPPQAPPQPPKATGCDASWRDAVCFCLVDLFLICSPTTSGLLMEQRRNLLASYTRVSIKCNAAPLLFGC